MRALSVSYFRSLADLQMQPSTRGVYRNAIERLCQQTDANGAVYGDKRATTMQREHIVKMMAARASKPESANILRKVLRAMMQHAVEIGLRSDDPTQTVRAIKTKSDGYHSWAEDEIEKFEKHHKIGTRSRLAFALLLFTGQRRGDVVGMGPQHVRGGAVSVRQQKTAAHLDIPMHTELAEIIAATPTNH